MNPNQTGYKAHAIQRGETFSVVHSVLAPRAGFNERVIFNGIPELAESIRTNGFRKSNPLIVEWNKDTGKFEIIHGERRYRAILHLVSRGIDPGPIWCMPESKTTTPLQQLFDQVITNTGEQFTPLEKGRLYLRIQTNFPEVTGADIARRVGETKQAVSNALRLAKLGCDKLHDSIIKGRISCTTALSIVEQAGDDHDAQVKLLDDTLQAAKTTGKSHATPKHLPPVAGTSSSSPSQEHPVPDSSAPSSTDSTFIANLSEDPPAEPSPSSTTKDLAPADPGAIQRLKNAPSTDRSGNSGPGSGGYEAPDKRLKSLESLLDELDKKGTGHEARITTTEIVLRYLNNEADRKAIKDHLLGK